MSTESLVCCNCRGPLHPEPGHGLGQPITCRYCGVLNRLDAPAPPPPVARPAPGLVHPFQPVMPGPAPAPPNVVAFIAAGILGAGLLITIGAIATCGGGRGGASSSLLSSGGAWEGVHGAILTDVNGDGTPDIVGRFRYVLYGDKVTLAAFDGTSGKLLWETETIGTYTDTYQGAVGLADDTLLYASATGHLRAFHVKTGKPKWKASLADKATRFCKAGAGQIKIELANKTDAYVHLADGHAGAPRAEGGKHHKGGKHRDDAKHEEDDCRRAADDSKEGDPSFRYASGSDLKIDGMRTGASIQRGNGPKIVFGVRDKGTSVPMIAGVFEDGKRSWKSDIAATRPLETGPFPPEIGAVTATRAYVVYSFASGNKAPSLAAFDVSGSRLWDVSVVSTMPLSAVQATDKRVLVSQWNSLHVYDAATGKLAFAIPPG